MPANGVESRTKLGQDTPLPGALPALVLLLTINLLNYIDRQVLSAVLPQIETSLFPGEPASSHDFQLGLLTTAFMVSYMVFAPLFGWMADRFSRWLLVGVGLIVWSLASGASGLATSFQVMFLTRCLVGIGEAAYGPAAPTILSDLYPVSRRGQIMAWFYMAIPVGSALGYVLGGTVADLMKDWRWAFYVVVPPGLLVAVFCFLIPDPKRGQADAGAEAPRTATLADYVILLRTPSYVLMTLGYTAQTFVVGGIGAWIVKYVHVFRDQPDQANISRFFGGILVVSGLTATLLGGLVADWLRPRLRGAYLLISGISTLLAFPLFLLVLYVDFPSAWALIFGTCFCLFFSTGPVNTVLANVTHPAIRASAFAVNIFVIHALGDVISPPIMGAINDYNGGNMNPSMLLVSFMMVLAGLFWLWGAWYLERDTELAPTRLAPEKQGG